jgi:hypothetical protein
MLGPISLFLPILCEAQCAQKGAKKESSFINEHPHPIMMPVWIFLFSEGKKQLHPNKVYIKS